jgi:two-component system, OmpR family, response regulator
VYDAVTTLRGGRIANDFGPTAAAEGEAKVVLAQSPTASTVAGVTSLRNRRLILAITDGHDTAAQISRAVWRREVDVLAFDVSSPTDALVAGAQSRPDMIVAELAAHHGRVSSVLEAIQGAVGFIPTLLLHRQTQMTEAPSHTCADARLTEPFSVEQIHAEVDALLHDSGADPTERNIRVGNLELNPTSREVTRNGSPIDLTRMEFDLLRFLLRNNGIVVSRSQILDHVWSQPLERSHNVVDVYISQLRKKIAPVDSPVIRTVRGVGFTVKRLATQPETSELIKATSSAN